MKHSAQTQLLAMGLLAAGLVALFSTKLVAGPPTRESVAKTQAEIAQIKTSLESRRTAGDKIRFLSKELDRTSNVDVGEKILEMAEQVGGPDCEPLLIHVVQGSAEARLRIGAVRKLAQLGTSSSIQPLLKCAEKDPTGEVLIGDIGTRQNARRDAYFSLAEIGVRLKDQRKKIADAIRELAVTSEALRDPKIQALYILTGDRDLLKPFYIRLNAADVETRKRGVVAFRFLKLKQAPPELVRLIDDPEPRVRSWVALVLGEVADPATVPVLVKAATNQGLDRGTRCNAIGSLGRMKAAAARPVMKDLLKDESVQVNAAIALSRISGVRHPLVPEGYGLD